MQCQWTIIKCWSNTQLSPLLYSLKKCLFWTITQKIPSGLKWNLQDKFVLISRSALCKNHAFFSCRVEAACFFFSPISWNFNFCLPICLALKWFKMHFIMQQCFTHCEYMFFTNTCTAFLLTEGIFLSNHCLQQLPCYWITLL